MRAIFFLNIFSFFIYTILGIYAFFRRRRFSRLQSTALDHTFILLCVLFALGTFGNAFFVSAHSSREASLWFRFFAFTWYYSPPLFFIFCLLLAGRPYKPSFLLFLVLPLIITGAHVLFPQAVLLKVTAVPLGWHAEYNQNSLWNWLNVFNYTVSGVGSLVVLLVALVTTSQRIVKQRVSLVLIALALTFFGTFFTGFVVRFFGVDSLPPMLPLFLSLLMVALAIALSRYDLLALTTAGVAERILKDVYDAVLLLNTDGMVLDTNVPHRYTAPNLTHFIPEAKDIPGWLQNHLDRRDLPFETRFAFESSRIAPAATRLRPIQGAGGALSGYIITAHDLSAEKDLALEVERRISLAATIRSVEANFSRAFRLSPAGMLIIERSSWVVLDANDMVSTMFCMGAQEIVGSRFTDLGIQVAEADLEPFITAIQRGQNCPTREVQFTCPNGQRTLCLVSAAPLDFGGKSAVLFTLVDSTELNRLRDSLARNQKLESIGILAGGLAHDFNNILTAVMGNISLIKLNLDEKDDTYQSALHAEAACLRARDLSHQLLTFSKGGEPNFEPVDIPLLVKEAVGMATAGSSVAFHLSLEGNISPAFVDRGQIFQCFNNIALNAVQAMSQGGTLDVAIRQLGFDKKTASPWGEIPEDLEKGDYVVVEFKDTGPGISEKDLGKIFDPYFSTKPQGSGLGLSIAYSILKRHHGGIGVLSTPGVGSRFFVYVPVAKDRVPSPAPVAVRMGKGEVLVMDDEYLVRLVVSQMLTRLGYEPTVCANGEAALEIFKAHRQEGRFFRSVILDLTIPDGMGGVEAARRLREVDPSIVLFVSSGYSDDPIMSEYKKYGFDGVISKPFGIEELSLRLSGGVG